MPVATYDPDDESDRRERVPDISGIVDRILRGGDDAGRGPSPA